MRGKLLNREQQTLFDKKKKKKNMNRENCNPHLPKLDPCKTGYAQCGPNARAAAKQRTASSISQEEISNRENCKLICRNWIHAKQDMRKADPMRGPLPNRELQALFDTTNFVSNRENCNAQLPNPAKRRCCVATAHSAEIVHGKRIANAAGEL